MKNGEHLQIIVEDNGIGRKKSRELKTKNQQTTASTGMKNIENRLEIINQLQNIKVNVQLEDLDRENQTGTRVIIDVYELRKL